VLIALDIACKPHCWSNVSEILRENLNLLIALGVAYKPHSGYNE
jgi:hypothetical protein